MIHVLHAAACVLAAFPADSGRMVPAIDFTALTVSEARQLDGAGVVMFFTIGAPTWAGEGVTLIGPGDMPDGSEWSAVLIGENFDFNPGDRVVVAGVLRVIRHPAGRVNGVDVPEWWQVTVTRAVVVK